MGCSASASKKRINNPLTKQVKHCLVEKVKLLERQIYEMKVEQENYSRVYEGDIVFLTLKVAQMKRERNKLKKMLEENECVCVPVLETSMFVEQINEERALRDEVAEKWKKLYLDIKVQLDDLIQHTHQGDRLYRKAEEGEVEILKAQLASMQKEEYKRAREIDILRQSLRIVSSKMATKVVAKGVSTL